MVVISFQKSYNDVVTRQIGRTSMRAAACLHSSQNVAWNERLAWQACRLSMLTIEVRLPDSSKTVNDL